MINSQDKCAIIGYGSWATAIVKILTENKINVYWHILNPDVLQSVETEARNCKYLRDVDLDTNYITTSDDINQVVDGAKVVILAMPSAFVKKFMEPLTVSLDDKFVISAVKGIVPDDYIPITDYIKNHYGVPENQVAIITGPSHAEEVGLSRWSYLTAVSRNVEARAIMVEMFTRPYIRVMESDDIEGVEYAAIMKNIYAIAVGLANGLGYGDNFIAVLIANSAAELSRMFESFGGSTHNALASACLGDLLVTCYSTYSRNRRLGLLIGRGCTVRSAMNEMTMVAEGYYAAKCIRHTLAERNVSMPIVDMVYEVLYHGASARRKMRELTTKLV
ncbi:MAG: NAD(P)H-dependent glycerol-3-phosphate dehydrogenase [Alistipes sp.]|nr:NAD(P)H-dependent glycerol-3-phosphate dehydrogenase [Alistipes sp.]